MQVTYHEGGAYDKPEGFKSLQQTLAKIEGAANASAAGRLFYLAIPPTAYTSVLQNIKAECTELMMKGEKDKCESWLRIIVEKPFGRDLPTSEELSCEVAKLFSESEIYRIDHFLGKELSQVRAVFLRCMRACHAVFVLMPDNAAASCVLHHRAQAKKYPKSYPDRSSRYRQEVSCAILKLWCSLQQGLLDMPLFACTRTPSQSRGPGLPVLSCGR